MWCNMKKTEQLIINTFLELVEEKPLDKITIQDIADKCGCLLYTSDAADD